MKLKNPDTHPNDGEEATMSFIQACARASLVRSSHGELLINEHGIVLVMDRYSPNDPESEFIANILRFDLAEWRFYWGKLKGVVIEDCDFDILDLGYWSANADGTSTYEPPEYSWREQAHIETRCDHAP